MSTLLLTGGAAALAAVFAYVQTVRLRSARRELSQCKQALANYQEAVNDLKETANTLADSDERRRLLEKLTGK